MTTTDHLRQLLQEFKDVVQLNEDSKRHLVIYDDLRTLAMKSLPAMLDVVDAARNASERLQNWSFGWDGDCGCKGVCDPLDDALAKLEEIKP